jgi:putative tryptophan/tyrosine transport system substrate-binding protein
MPFSKQRRVRLLCPFFANRRCRRRNRAAERIIAYGPSIPASFRRAATYLDKILRGAKPADLPVEQPTTFELAVNLQSASAIGITIPTSIVMLADEVIQ